MAQQAGLAYSSEPLAPKVIRSWGDGAMRDTMTAWEAGFRKHHPEIAFQDTLLGTASGMAGIITGTSDLSLMGRPATANEVMGFEWVFRVKPLGIRVMNGSLKTEGETPALAVFVSRRNPLKEISMEQLASLLGCPADPHAPVTWAMAGLGGAWKSRPVHAFLYDDQTGTGAFLQRAIQEKRDCWNWEVVREFKDRIRADGQTYPAAEQIADALARDPYGIAVSTLQYTSPAVKAVPVAGLGAAVPLTRESVVDGTYPLRRGVYIYINRTKDRPVDSKVLQFLRFVLSPEGQALVRSSGDFLPLNANEVEEQLKKLE